MTIILLVLGLLQAFTLGVFVHFFYRLQALEVKVADAPDSKSIADIKSKIQILSLKR